MASLPKVNDEKRSGEMTYLLGSSPRKRNHYQRRGLMAAGDSERRLTSSELASESLLEEHGIQSDWVVLVTEEGIFRRAS